MKYIGCLQVICESFFGEDFQQAVYVGLARVTQEENLCNFTNKRISSKWPPIVEFSAELVNWTGFWIQPSQLTSCPTIHPVGPPLPITTANFSVQTRFSILVVRCSRLAGLGPNTYPLIGGPSYYNSPLISGKSLQVIMRIYIPHDLWQWYKQSCDPQPTAAWFPPKIVVAWLTCLTPGDQS